MSALFIKVEALPGTNIRNAIAEAQALVNTLGFTVQLTFNGRPVYVVAGDSFEDIYDRWSKEK